MGSGNTKDQNIDLYMHTNKQYYVAGQYVQGQVYLSAKNISKYSNICLKFNGEQHVYWSQGSGKNRRSYSNTYKSYTAYQLLVDFHGTVNKGQYSFPFSLLLPSMMSGSFIYSQSCYIKYMLRVQLVHPTQQKGSQYYQFHLNILQPPRMPIGALTLTNTVNSKCCGCCTDYGNTVVTMNSDKNFVLNGDNIQINGLINNSQGKQKIQQYKLVLEEKRVMISSGGRTRHSTDNTYPLLSSNNNQVINPGAQKQFYFNGQIPANIVTYTAIGRCVGRYFILHLYTSYGCCANTAQAILHVIVHSRTPMIVQKKQMPPPQNWYPQMFPKIQVQNMKPYVYTPLPQIPYLNMPGNQNVIINTNPNTNGYPDIYSGYQMPTNDFVPQINQALYMNYQPTYYNQDVFTQEEQYQQGYKGYQPYFAHQNTEVDLQRKY